MRQGQAAPGVSGGAVMKPPETVEVPWALSGEEVVARLGVQPREGFDPAEVERRRRVWGPNVLRPAPRRSAWSIFLEQFRNILVLLLAVACLLAFVFGEWLEGWAIAAVLLINAALGFITEVRAVRSMEALHRLTRVTAKVLRGGRLLEAPAEDLVPGDVVEFEAGDLVPADLRLLSASKLQADESTLTGESAPVDKRVDPAPAAAPLAERSSMLFAGTAVVRGSAKGLVTATGAFTELGQIAALAEEARPEETPLEKRLAGLGRALLWVSLFLAALTAAAGVAGGKGLFLMLETGIALAVAAVPEGLPIVATVALARGVWRMASRNALVQRLSSVETLGSTTVIITDKTGTLTENRQAVVRLVLPAGAVEVTPGEENGLRWAGQPVEAGKDPGLAALLRVAVLCNNAALDSGPAGRSGAGVGDPLERALLALGRQAGLERPDLLRTLPEVREEAFDSDTKSMATFHREGPAYRVAVKGAPESVLGSSSRVLEAGEEKALSEEARERWLAESERLAREGLRVLGFASRTASSAEAEPYRELTFLGLTAFLDPPRAEVRESLAACRRAGIRVVMCTGDQAATALTVARAVGLVEGGQPAVLHGERLRPPAELSPAERSEILLASVLARVSPRQKLHLVSLYQEEGWVVAMTGDGVNDAPALRKADIGIAMGQRGTQVAAQAADVVLKDDAFSTIVAAAAQGRAIFNNIRRLVRYLLSCNASEVLVVALASLANAPLPLLPLQILFLNMVTDVFPALALGLGEGDPSLMERPPRDPRRPILGRRDWLSVGGYALVLTASVLGVFGLALAGMGLALDEAITLSFLTLALAQLLHVFNARETSSGLLRNDVVRNPHVWGALLVCVGLLLLAVHVPVLAGVLDLSPPGALGWGLAAAASLVPLLLGQSIKALRARRGRRRAPPGPA